MTDPHKGKKQTDPDKSCLLTIPSQYLANITNALHQLLNK